MQSGLCSRDYEIWLKMANKAAKRADDAPRAMAGQREAAGASDRLAVSGLVSAWACGRAKSAD